MGETIKVIEEHSGGTCYQTERMTLDHVMLPEYQDEGENFNRKRVFETNIKKGQKVLFDLESPVSSPSLFSYFLDGSRRTYKVRGMHKCHWKAVAMSEILRWGKPHSALTIMAI